MLDLPHEQVSHCPVKAPRKNFQDLNFHNQATVWQRDFFNKDGKA
jgi:hypothetical protein